MKEESGINGLLNALDLMNNVVMQDISVQTDPIRVAISAPSILIVLQFEERKAQSNGASQNFEQNAEAENGDGIVMTEETENANVEM